MDSGFIALNIFLLITLGLILLPLPVKRLIRNKTSLVSIFIRPKVSYGMIYLYTFTVICVLTVCFSGGFDVNKNPDEVIKYGQKENLFDHQYWAYHKKLENYKYDYSSVYFFHLTHKQSEGVKRFWDEQEEFENIQVPSGYDYEKLTQSKVKMDRELGFFGSAAIKLIYYNDNKEAIRFLDSLTISRKPFVNCLYGLCQESNDTAKAYFLREIYNKGDVFHAVQMYSKYCGPEDNFEGLEFIYNNDTLRPFIPLYVKKTYSFIHHKYLDFISFEIQHIFEDTSPFVIFCTIFILAIWLFFLNSIDLFEKEKTKYILLTFALSFVSFIICAFIYSTLHYSFGINRGNENFTDLLYCIFCIGGTEEFVKIVPLLVLLYFTKVIDEPIDYIFYAGLSALSFSILEDFIYFNRESINVIFSRGIFTSFSHIADSSFIAYALVLAKYQYKKLHVPFFILGFVFACVSHGIYDFFIINDEFNIWIIPFVILMLQSWWFVHIINNCLNNSTSFNPKLLINTRNLGIIISGGLFTLILMVYFHSALYISPQYATWNLFVALLFYSYILFFFNICINRIDIFRGEWDNFSLKYFVDPKIFFAGLNHKYAQLSGKTIQLTPLGRKTYKLLPFLPLITKINQRLKINSYKGWFMARLEFPIVLNNHYYHEIYFRTQENYQPIELNERQAVAIYGLKKPEYASKELKQVDLVFLDWVFIYLKSEEV